MEIKVIENENEIYVREKLLGQGAFGKAYLVRHISSGEQLVIKEMSIEHMSTKEREETIKEAQILRNLNHPNIVNFKEVYITKNKLKIVMEYAECGDLAKAISARKAKKEYFQEVHILDWFTQICLAIKHVHDRKILHRDIKGQNIFIAKNNSLKLGDFGIARVLNMTNDKARTVVGTPYYLSPEIIENKPYSFKSDIWSIGAVLYELCALQPPFQATSLQMLALKIVKGSYTPIQSNYSKELKSLIAEMLTLDPSKRPNIQEILQKPVIQGRIVKFLSETKRIAEFSHTILHNQKVEIFANKLVQIQKEKEIKKTGSNEKNIEYERQKLKDEQLRLEARLKQKKEDDIKKEEKRRQDEIRRREEEVRRKEEERKKRLVYEQEKREQMQREYEQNQRQAEIFKQRRIEEDRAYQRQAEIRREKEEYESKERRESERMRKANKEMEEERKKMDYADLARKQFFENQEIMRKAKERAQREESGFYSEPSREETPPSTKNLHDLEENRPQTKQDSRRNSTEKKQYQSDLYNRHDIKKKEPEPFENELNNAYCNPNYNKKSTQASKWEKEKEISNEKKSSVLDTKEKKEPQSNKKIEEQREQMKKDRENFMKNKLGEENNANKGIGKWEKRRSSSKKNEPEEEKYESPRFKKFEEPSKETEEEEKLEEFNEMIEDSENLFLEAKNPQEFNQYIGELEEILQGVQKKIDLLPDIPLSEEIKFRDDDIFELSLTADLQKKEEEETDMDSEGVDLDYFSNYSKLETLRMQLEETFGLDNFIKLYRLIEKEVNEKGLNGFNMSNVIKEMGEEINSKLVNKNTTLLLTLVALEDNMSYT